MCIFKSLISFLGINWVSGGVESAVGCNEYVVAEYYRSFVKYHEIMIGVEVISYMNVVAIIAKKRLLNQEIALHRA